MLIWMGMEVHQRRQYLLRLFRKLIPAACRLYKEIADNLAISISTVKQHIHHIYEKLQVQNRSEAILRYLGQ